MKDNEKVDSVKEILENVRVNGDKAVLEYNISFDQNSFPDFDTFSIKFPISGWNSWGWVFKM
jgi:histidinol dehydrogenase